MRIDIWTDVVCPFCFVGKEHLNQALESFEHADEVEVHWRAFELDPTLSAQPEGTLVEAIAKKYQVSVEDAANSQRQMAQRLSEYGVEFDWEHAKFGNTFDAHRLIQFAQDKGKGTQMQDALMRAYLEQGKNIAEHAVLLDIATGVGCDRNDVAALLEGDEYGDIVRADEAQAHQIGVQGVPFFVLNAKFALSGAQPVEVMLQGLEHAWADEKNLLAQPTQAQGCCGSDGCCGGSEQQ
ncbi:DsbA family oxidoreductase [Corynebacterium pelargi]|uniref:DSBA-like thioredoxin domain protein n=1 Tax=Corynebacterium pelargi TaxID=1471400 RepID=A0A410W7Q5_9CORY|nr:DsbA family oxidoreductase [Corynebacterium pelargi]QAU51980.1 DSBA-like thioredoxin domain protein [Corynebacterium pelargi]